MLIYVKTNKMKFTENEIKNIVIDYKNGMTPKELSEKYKRNSGTIIGKLQSLGIFVSTKYRFTEEDIAYLREHYPKDDIQEIMKHFPKSTKQSIHSICSRYNIQSKQREECKWTKNELEIIEKYYYSKSLEEIYNMIGGRHTMDAIQSKALKFFGYSKSRDWTEDEDKIMIQYYSKEPVDSILKRLPNRTRNSVINRARILNLTSYIKVLTNWTEEETQYLIENWLDKSDKQLAKEIGKSQKSIKSKRYYLGLSRTANHYNKATYENLNKFLRGNSQDWKNKSMLNCNYQCVLSGSKDFAIHHLYSFSRIVNEIIKENNFELKSSFSDYTESELVFILEKFNQKHSQYPLGVCVRKDLHDLFHKEYGQITTPNMWYEFVEKYSKGEYT